MRLIRTFVAYAGIYALMYAGEVRHIEGAHNVLLLIVFLLSSLGAVCVLADLTPVWDKRPRPSYSSASSWLFVFALAYFGWFFFAIVMAIEEICIYVKFQIWKDNKAKGVKPC